MNFNLDPSTQSITSLSLITGSYNAVATKADVNLKQDLLTSSTILLGIGSNLSALDYNKITLNKPTNFQSDWNSTIINKPTNFQTDWNSTIINKPTNFQSDWNSTIINKPVIYTQTEVNNISNLCANFTINSSNINSNFTYNSSNILNTKINTKQDILTYYPIDPAIYYNKTQTDTLLNAKEAVLTFSAPLTRTTNTIGINLNSYVPFTALSASNYITNSTNGLINYPSYTTLNSCNYITNTNNTLVYYPSYTTLNSCNYITNTNNTLVYYPSYTTLNSCNYITNTTSGLTNYYTKTSIDSSLATKEAILTFNAPLSRSVNAVSIDLTNYYTKIQDDTLSNNNSNFTYNTSNILNNKINLYLTSNGGSLIGNLNTNSKFLTTNNTNVGVPTVSTTGTGDKLIFTNGGTNFYPNSIGLENAGSLWISSCNNLKFYNNGINSMTIQGNGAIGIGTTQNFNNASYKFDVRGDLIATSLTTIDNNKNWLSYISTYTTGETIFQTGGVSLSYCPDLKIQTNFGNLYLGNSGINSNVYINGSTVRTNNLTIYNTDTWQTSFTLSNLNGNAYQLNIGGSTNTAIGTNAMGIYDGNSGVNNYIMVWKGGSVGIGLTSIASGIKFQVEGQLRVSGGANIGTVQLSGGGALQSGYIAFNNPSGNRVGYVGWSNNVSGEQYLFLQTESTQNYVGYCLNGKLVVGWSNAYPQIQMGETNGHNLGIATIAGAFSSSASIGDMVLRSINKLHLQSGTGVASITINANNNVGIGNTNPITGGGITYFCVGDSSTSNSDGAIVIGKKNTTGGTRFFRIGNTTSFYWAIGDAGNNNTAGTWLEQVRCYYSAPSASLDINLNGVVYGVFVNTSDERIKTNIKTIDYALDKVLLLRGVNYTLISENTDEIGMIAQEVELIVPEAVKTNNNNDNLKGINYQGLVGLLVEAIKQLNNKVENLENILKNNNLY
jgi:hypothetical protein